MSVYTNPANGTADETAAYVAAITDLVGDRDPMAVLRETPAALPRTLEGLSPAQIARPEAAGKWSMAAVLQHLADAEVVWAWRMRLILAQDRPTITGYDQDRWADRLRYADADPAEAIGVFTTLRGANLRLLQRASRADLDRVGLHAERGEESLAHVSRLYAGHDLLHLRQLDRIRRVVA